MPSTITILTCGDNYIYISRDDERNALVVDPSEAGAVLGILREQRLTLTTVLVTHHHWDHTGGVAELKKQTACQVVGADGHRIGRIDKRVEDGEVLTFGGQHVMVLTTPGHTRTSVCYHLLPSAPREPGAVWTGDTLFVGGCGRPMECDASILWESLEKLAALPDDTLVYCGHDYTAENYEFALTVEPGNQAVQQRLREVRQATAKGRPSVPSSIAQEKRTNIFLRSSEAAVRKALGMTGATPKQVFLELCRRKNLFG